MQESSGPCEIMNHGEKKGLPMHPLEPPFVSLLPSQDSKLTFQPRGHRLAMIPLVSTHRDYWNLDSSAHDDDSSSAYSPVPYSQSIPIDTSAMKRTPSEIKLREDEEFADYRDYLMFTRIVDRMARQQQQIRDYRLRRENDLCLAHVIGTRNGLLEDNHTASSSTVPSASGNAPLDSDERWGNRSTSSFPMKTFSSSSASNSHKDCSAEPLASTTGPRPPTHPLTLLTLLERTGPSSHMDMADDEMFLMDL